MSLRNLNKNNISSTAFLLFMFWFPFTYFFTFEKSANLGVLDKVIHFLLFFWWTIFNKNLRDQGKAFFLFIVLALSFLTEAGQHFIPTRYFSFTDLIADIAGASNRAGVMQFFKSKPRALRRK